MDKLKLPKLKIVTIDEEYDMQDLKNTIINQNYINLINNNDLEVNHIKYIPPKKIYTAYIETS